MKNDYIKILEEICNEEGFELKTFSKDWIHMIKKGNTYKCIAGYKFDLNSQASSCVADDKFALYDVLKDKNIPIIEHNILFNQNNNYDYASDSNKYSIVHDYFIKHKNIVLKANAGTCGTEVFNIKEEKDIDPTLNLLFPKNHSISYCPFYDIENEYRVIVLNNEVKLVYKKIKPSIIGDGVKTIKELLLEFNYSYFKDKLDDEKYNRILSKDETYEYDWKFNLSRGARASQDISNDIKKEVTSLALKCMDILKLKFCSVDIIKCKDGKTYVMEINSGVMMKNIINCIDDGYNVVKNIYHEAILEMFK